MFGEALRALTTTLYSKDYKGTRLIAVPNGKNVRDWVIRKLTTYGRYCLVYGRVSETERVWVNNEGFKTT
jgi:hypothetical protein